MKRNISFKRAQAALEFLTTYGWAFLVILIMIGALAYFGVLNPSNLVPDTCTAGSGFTCTEYKLTEGGAIELIVVNTLESISIDNLTAITVSQTGTTGCTAVETTGNPDTVGDVEINDVSSSLADSTPDVVEAGQTITLHLDCTAGDFVAGDRFQGDVEIRYTPVGKTLEKTVVIDLSVKAQ